MGVQVLHWSYIVAQIQNSNLQNFVEMSPSPEYFHQYSHVPIPMNVPKALQDLSLGFANQNLWLVFYQAGILNTSSLIQACYLRNME